jgi:hypothetical protein
MPFFTAERCDFWEGRTLQYRNTIKQLRKYIQWEQGMRTSTSSCLQVKLTKIMEGLLSLC